MYAKKREKLETEHNKTKKKLNQEEKDAVLQTTAATFNIIGQMLGENSAAGKAAAVASATINTYQAATNALANTPGPPPIPQIAAGIAIASGIMNVKKILSTKTPGPTGGAAAAAGGVPSAPSIPAVDPTAALGGNIEGETGQNTVTLGEQTGSSSANVVRAYVVSDEMTSQQEADKKINDLARL
jgi:hypothetical protein